MCGASNLDGRTAAPGLLCFASLAMTDRELAHLFLRVALDAGGNRPRVGLRALQKSGILRLDLSQKGRGLEILGNVNETTREVR